jgi:hypothetical protein
MRGTQARAYGTRIEAEVPDSLTRLVEEAIVAACTFYENQFNGGEPFPPAQLSPGPGARGAVEGAARRAEKRAADASPGPGRAATAGRAPARRKAGAPT